MVVLVVARSFDWVERMPPQLRRWWRYGITSVVATAVSEAVLVVVYASGLLGASASAVVASLVGAVPSYVMSRYWIWAEADRAHFGRQASGFFVVSVLSLVISSVLTGVAANHAPRSHAAHVAVVATVYVGVYGLLWVVKFVLYQRVLFRSQRPAAQNERHSSVGSP